MWRPFALSKRGSLCSSSPKSCFGCPFWSDLPAFTSPRHPATIAPVNKPACWFLYPLMLGGSVAHNPTAGCFRWPEAVDRDRSDARSRQVEPEPGPSLLLFDEEEHNLRSAYGPGGLASAMHGK
jgi:hypothetical protein